MAGIIQPPLPPTDGVTIDSTTGSLRVVPTSIVMEQETLSGSTSDTIAAGPVYIHPSGGRQASAAAAETRSREWIAPYDGTARGLQVSSETAFAAGESQTCVVRKNRAATTLTCTLGPSIAADIVVEDAVHSFTFVKGDRLSIEWTRSAGAAVDGPMSHSFKVRRTA